MTFRDFARNYLSPFYVIARLFWLWGAFLFALPFSYAQFFEGWQFVSYLLAAWMFWVGVKPWDRGMSINDINQKLDKFNNR